MLNVKELMNELEIGDNGKELINYSGGSYICDAISEIVDSNTSIYYSDIMNFISENVEAVNDAIAEFGWNGCGSDLYKAGQMAEHCTIQNEIYECLDDSMKYYALNYYEDLDIHNEKIDTSEISEDLWEEIENYCDGVDHNSTFSEIEEIIDNYIESMEEEEVEYEQSMIHEIPTKDMIELVEDMDLHDYDEEEDIIDLYTMEKIFEEFLENY